MGSLEKKFNPSFVYVVLLMKVSHIVSECSKLVQKEHKHHGQSKPVSKPVSPVNVCLQNPRFVIKTLIFNLFLVLLLFSTYFNLSIVTLNIFINLILLKVIFLTNFTSLRKRLILFISLHSSYLRSMLDTVIIFQSFRTILKITTSDVSFFTRLLYISAIFNIIVQNFAKNTFFLTSVEMF